MVCIELDAAQVELEWGQTPDTIKAWRGDSVWVGRGLLRMDDV
jgi:hypothetical protein